LQQEREKQNDVAGDHLINADLHRTAARFAIMT
jgi:hypothetical protein